MAKFGRTAKGRLKKGYKISARGDVVRVTKKRRKATRRRKR